MLTTMFIQVWLEVNDSPYSQLSHICGNTLTSTTRTSNYLKVSLLTQNGCDVQINNRCWSQLSCMKKKTSLLYIKFNLKHTSNSSLHKRLKSYSPEWIFGLLFLLIYVTWACVSLRLWNDQHLYQRDIFQGFEYEQPPPLRTYFCELYYHFFYFRI